MFAAGRSLVRTRSVSSVPVCASRQGWPCLCKSFSASAQSDMTSSMGSEEGEGQGTKGGVRGVLPMRMVPDAALRFKCRGYIGSDTGDRYPNVHGVHPAEFKVELKVIVSELGLSPAQVTRLKMLVGPRYNQERDELRLISERFPNRIDNKRYLVHLLEKLVLEAHNV